MTPIHFAEHAIICESGLLRAYRAPTTCPVCKAEFGTCKGMQRYGFRFSLDKDGFAEEPFRFTGAGTCKDCGLCCDSDHQCSDCYHRDEYDAGLDGWDEDER